MVQISNQVFIGRRSHDDVDFRREYRFSSCMTSEPRALKSVSERGSSEPDEKVARRRSPYALDTVPFDHWGRHLATHTAGAVDRPAGKRAGRSSARVDEALYAVYNRLGGVDAFLAFAKDDPASFYRMFSKLLPSKIELDANVYSDVVRAIQAGRSRAGIPESIDDGEERCDDGESEDDDD